LRTCPPRLTLRTNGLAVDAEFDDIVALVEDAQTNDVAPPRQRSVAIDDLELDWSELHELPAVGTDATSVTIDLPLLQRDL